MSIEKEKPICVVLVWENRECGLGLFELDGLFVASDLPSHHARIGIEAPLWMLEKESERKSGKEVQDDERECKCAVSKVIRMWFEGEQVARGILSCLSLLSDAFIHSFSLSLPVSSLSCPPSPSPIPLLDTVFSQDTYGKGPFSLTSVIHHNERQNDESSPKDKSEQSSDHEKELQHLLSSLSLSSAHRFSKQYRGSLSIVDKGRATAGILLFLTVERDMKGGDTLVDLSLSISLWHSSPRLSPLSPLSLHSRPFQGPTSMDASLSLLSSNLCLLSRIPSSLPPSRHIVWDPFVGSGSLLLAASGAGALCFGSDLSASAVGMREREKVTSSDEKIEDDKVRQGALPGICENFSALSLSLPDVILFDFSLSLPLRELQFFTGIVCDPPYGIRIAVDERGVEREEERKSVKGRKGPKVNEHGTCLLGLSLLRSLWRASAAHLVAGGRVVHWAGVDSLSLSPVDLHSISKRIEREVKAELDSLSLSSELSLVAVHTSPLKTTKRKGKREGKWGTLDLSLSSSQVRCLIILEKARARSVVEYREVGGCILSPPPLSLFLSHGDVSVSDAVTGKTVAQERSSSSTPSPFSPSPPSLFEAAWTGDLEMAGKSFSSNGCDDVNSVNKSGATPLLIGEFSYDFFLVHFLYQISLLSVYFFNVLFSHSTHTLTHTYTAAGYGHTALCSLLLSHGADPQKRDGRGDNSILRAVKQGHVGTAEVLLEREREEKGEESDEESERGKLTNVKTKSNVWHYACGFGKESMLQSELFLSVALSSPSPSSSPSLSLSHPSLSPPSSPSKLSLLLAHDKNGLTPLHYAARWNQHVFLKSALALSHFLNALPHSRSVPQHQTVVHTAAQWGHVESLSLFLSLSPSLFLEKDGEDNTFLHVACMFGREKVVDWVKENEGSVSLSLFTQTNSAGQTPGDVATSAALRGMCAEMERRL